MSAGNKGITIDKKAWARNLRVAPDATPDDDALKRWLNNYFAFWVICPTRACKRTKRCAGDPRSCHDRIWPHMPERIKFQFHATLTAVNDGLSAQEVTRKVKEELARFDETTRVLGQSSGGTHGPAPRGAEGEAPLSPTAVPANESPPRGPRVRMM